MICQVYNCRKVSFVREHLLDPTKWKEPRLIFVNSMSDLFHESLEFELIHQIVDVIQECPQHVFQVLTKRAKRMLEFCREREAMCQRIRAAGPLDDTPEEKESVKSFRWPLPNVWLGVSVESPKYKDRIDILRETPATVRMLSLEPLLEDLGQIDLRQIHWMIVGGESGPHARPMDPAWARSIRDQCQAAGVPFFYKQWGEWAPLDQTSATRSSRREVKRLESGAEVFKLGKHATGRMLDGREWSEYPKASEVAGG